MLSIKSKHYSHILSLLNSPYYESRLIGGCVRDAIYKNGNHTPSTDIDIATTLLPDAVIALLKQHGITCLITGIKYGTVTAIYSKEKFEITTLRSDLLCDGRYAKVEFTEDFRLDAKRRDFTINALSYSISQNKIYDYHNGLQDLQAEKVIFIGEAEERIKEDYLRILRFFRFSAYYANNLDIASLEACQKLAPNISILSKERIKTEIDKLIASPSASYVLSAMVKSDILKHIYPFTVNYEALARAIEFSKLLQVNCYYSTRYAILFSNANIDINDLISHKFSKNESKKILSIIEVINSTKYYSLEFILNSTRINYADYQEYIIALVATSKLSISDGEIIAKKYTEITIPNFPITSEELMDLGITDKNLGITIKKLKHSWINSNFKLSKKELLQEAL